MPNQTVMDIDQLLDRVKSYNAEADLAIVRKAYDFSAKVHEGQRRRSGEPYLQHPIAVAGVLTSLKTDVTAIVAALLHDTLEDTMATPEELESEFGKDVVHLVDGVTKIGKITFKSHEEKQAENFRKMLLSMADDIRVVLIKLADRLHNMRTLEHLSPTKRQAIAEETLEIYAPLANRLGIGWIKNELEDLCLKHLKPDVYEMMRTRVAKRDEDRQQYIQEVIELVTKALQDHGLPGQVYGRPKHLWSIFQKIKKSGRDLDQIFDLIAFRVLTESVRDCYAVLGVVHSNWTPVPGRFKDFIALPKPNLYQSLHTTVIGPRADRMEVQIRTQDMHRTAEQGIAAHWKYKEQNGAASGAGGPMSSADGKAFAWLRQLMEWQRDLKDPTEFIETVKIDLFQDEVFVFTPKGDVKALPKGSTPIDLAYAVHSQVGEHCSGARVNGLIVPLRYALRNGDNVEILTSANQKPSKDWLKFVITSRAKTKIRHHIRMEQQERSRQMGRDLLARELRKRNYALGTAEREGLLDEAATRLRVGNADDLLVALGYGKISVEQAANAVLPDQPATEGAQLPPEPDTAPQPIKRPKRSIGGIRVQGEADIVVKFAKCCSPVPGDSIIGFISRGHGVVIHTRDCPKALDLDPVRRVDVAWDDESKTLRPVAIQVSCEDRPGLLASISKSFTEHGVNISQAKCRTTEDGRAVNTFQVTVGHLEQLKTVLRSLQEIDGVVAATRI